MVREDLYEGWRKSVTGGIDLPKALPADFRRTVFMSQDGLMLCLLVSAFAKGGILMSFLNKGETSEAISVPRLSDEFGANPAYLAVAMRCMAQNGWLKRFNNNSNDTLSYVITDKFKNISESIIECYRRLGDFFTEALPLEKSILKIGADSRLVGEFLRLVEMAKSGWGEPANEVLQVHLTGALLVPILVSLMEIGMLQNAPTYLESTLPEALDLLTLVGWINKDQEVWTEEGGLARDHAIYLGMMCSYIPMLVRLYDIIFNDSEHRTHTEVGQVEQHVDRKLNILASGAAHKKYFANVVEMFVDIFDQYPVENQPKFVMDTGCGDGSWLKHIYEVVVTRTKRGKVLDKYPLIMVGVDYNAVCEDVCLGLLQGASIPALFLIGDITDPEGIAEKLEPHGLLMSEGLHVRSFIDHNRLFEFPVDMSRIDVLEPTGAYVDENGDEISGRVLRQNLVGFLQEWAKYADPHGLIILEAHCVDPDTASRHIGDTHNIVFDTYHGFSHQYPVDFEIFMDCASDAGLYSVIYQQQRYPSRKPFVSISANHFKKSSLLRLNPVPVGESVERDAAQWIPDGKFVGDDGDALHALLYREGRLDQPRSWCHGATGLLLRPILNRISVLLGDIERGYTDRREIHIADYGAGTGMASIELLQACQENGFIERCARLGVRFHISLLDIPSEWFAKAFEMMECCPFVEFYSIRDCDSNRFLPLDSILGCGEVDIVMASMVFHLIPLIAMESVLENIARVLSPKGVLYWNSPDVGPACAGAVLFHDANRQVRKIFRDCLVNPEVLLETNWAKQDRHSVSDVVRELHELVTVLTPGDRMAFEAKANRQVLKEANQAEAILSLAKKHFHSCKTHVASFEIREEEVVDTLLVPANQRYLGEITNSRLREQIIRGLMLHDVIPELHNSVTGTRFGYSVHWTYGEFEKYD